MKNLFAVILLLVSASTFSQVTKEIIWNELTKDKSIVLEQDAEGSYILNNFPFKTKFENKANAVNTFSYEEDGKVISFTPYGIKLRDNKNTFIPAPKVGATKLRNKNNTDSVAYIGGMGTGVSIINEVTKGGYRKIIKIDNDKVFGALNGKVDSVELIFEIKNLTFDSLQWDKKITKIFKTQQRLSELSYLQPVTIWNSDTSIIVPAKLYAENGKMFIAKVLPVSFFKSDRPVYTDITITFGTNYIFNGNTDTSNLNIFPLNETSVFIVYVDLANSNYITAQIANISGTTVSFGNEYVILASPVSSVTLYAAVLTSTSVFITYGRYFGGWNTYATIATVSGTTISFGSEYSIITGGYANSNRSVSAISLTSTEVMVIMGNRNNDYAAAVKCTITGTVISSGSVNNFITGDVSFIHANKLSSTCVLIVYLISGGSYSRTLYTSGTNVVSSSETTLWSSCYSPFVAVLSPTQAIATAIDINDYRIYSRTINISGNSIVSVGADYSNINYKTSGYGAFIEALNPTTVIMTYPDYNNGHYGTACLVNINGSTIAYDTRYTYNSISTLNSYSVKKLTDTVFVLGWLYSGSRGYLTIGSIPPSGKKINGITYTKWNNSTISKLNNL